MTESTEAAAVAAPKHLSPAEKRALLARLLEERREGGMKRAPVSFSQRRLWFLDQLAPGSSFYNVDIALRLPSEPELNEEAFVRAIGEIVRRHEALRTTFEALDGEPLQVIRAAPAVRPQIVDLRHLPAADQDAEALRVAAEQTARPFDLARGPLMRVSLLRLHDHYLLVLVMHHIICDGWSMGVFTREFGTLYAAFCAGLPSPLPELAIQYSDFASWQQSWLRGEAMERQVRYWTEQLRGIQALQLPTDRPRPRVQAFRGAYEPVHIGAGVVESLRSLGEREGATLFMILLAAFQVLLARYAGQDDIAVGTYIANRNRAEVEHLIGFFINTLVMRTSTAGNPPFREFLARVRETALAAYANQDAPFEVLVEALHPERDLSRNPLFQVVFQLFNAPNVDTRAASAEDSAPALEKRTAIFDIAFSLWETSDGLGGGFEYNTDLFDARTIRRMGAHYANLLAGIADEPTRPIAELPMLCESERRQCVVAWNATHRELDAAGSVMRLFWERVRSSGHKVALIRADARVTYRELGERVAGLASRLARHGAQPERLLGICLERSIEAVVAVLATFEAGAAYVPMNPDDPADRHDFIARDADLFALITRSDFAPSLRGERPARIELDRLDAGEAAPDERRARGTHIPLNRLAYAIYTSGSTGTPKGVAAEHRQIVNRLEWMWREYPFGEDEVSCQKTALTFVDSLWELLGPLLQGVPSVVVPEQAARDPRRLLDVLARHAVTRLWLVPTLLRELIDILESDPALVARLDRLTFWVSSGEPLPVALAERFARLLPHATLYNLYGTSEIWDATWHDPRREAPQPGRAPIGRPIDNVQAYVLGASGALAPIGVAGELCIGGAGLARGYLNRPELTRERFVPDPFVPGGRLYRTGDAARYLPDGQIEYIGRLDRQVKLRGFRIEPGEIEAALGSHAGVRDCAVIAQDGTAGRQLTAYVAPRADADPSPDELIDFLQARLPAHMIPASFVFLEQLPKTTSGKINRSALPMAGPSVQRERQARVAPRSALEAAVVQLYEQVLGVENVGVHDHFFRELGGHSLLATRLASRIRSTLDVDVPLQTFFEAPTPAALAEKIEQFKSLLKLSTA